MPLGFQADPTVKPEFGFEIDPDHPHATGLAECWAMAEGLGGMIGDLAGRQVALLTSAPWGPIDSGARLLGLKLNFNGSTSYALATAARLIGGADANRIAIDIMFRPSVMAATRYDLFANVEGTANTVTVEIGNAGAGTNAVNVVGSGVGTIAQANNALSAGQWYHLIYARGGSGATHEIDLNGVRQTLAINGTTGFADAAVTRILGAATTTPSRPFAGDIAWVRVWRRYMAPDERQRLYAEPWAMATAMPSRRFFVLAGASSFSFSPSGGLVLGGTSSPGVTFSPAPSGGLVSGGTASPGVTFSPPPSGGAVLGGQSSPSFSADVSPSGGVILGGVLSASFSADVSPSGGVILGGAASGTLSGSGLIVRPHLDPTIKPPLGWPADPEAAINRDLVGWWIANEGQGRVWADLVSGISAIFPATPTWAADLRGPTVSISGPSSNQIAAASNASGIYDLTGPLTVSAWITVAASGAGGHGFVSKGTGALLQGYALRWNGSNNPVFTTGGGAAASSLTGATVLAVGVTYHLVGVYDGAGGRLYVNGKLDASGAMANAPTASGTDLKFGSFGDGSAIHTGLIGDVRLYRRALTADEVGTLYSAPDAGLMPPTIRLISSGAPSFSYSPSGGAVLGGASSTSFSVTVSPSGGVILGGTAPGSSAGGSFSFSPSGGLVAGGASTPGVTFSPVPSGGLKAGGTATPTATFSIAASGGILAGGTASPGVTFSPPPSGGAVLGGTAPGTLIGANSFSYTPSGGVLVGGSAFVFMAVASLPCDRVAYDAIKALLEGLGEFDGVTIGRELAFKPTQASLGKFCHIQPLGTPTLVQDDSPWVLMNVAKFRLVVAVREPNDEDTLRAIDRLKGAIMFSLLKAENRAYGGFCRPWLSKLRPVSIPGRKDIGLPMEFQGEFSYMVSTQIGYDSTSD